MRIFLIFVLVCLLAGTSCRKHTDILVIGTNQWIGYEPLYLASTLGLLPVKEFRVVQYSSTEEVLRAYRSGIVAVAAVTGDELFQAVRSVPDTKAFLITDISNGSDALVARNSIQSVPELKGRRVAVEAGALGAYMLTRILQKNQMNPEDITPVYSLYQNHIELFKNEKADAVVTFEPNKTKLINLGGHEIFSSREIPDEIVDVLITREQTIKDRKRDLHKLVHIWFTAQEKLMEGSDSVLAAAAVHQGISTAEVKQSLAGIILPDSAKNRELITSPDKLEKTLQMLHKTLISAGLIESEPMPSNIISSVLLEHK